MAPARGRTWGALFLAVLLGQMHQAEGRRGGGPPPPSPMDILESANCHQDGHNVTETCYECHDGLDNDGDGIMDCDDPDCATHPACDVHPEGAPGGRGRGRGRGGNDVDDVVALICGTVVILVAMGLVYRRKQQSAAGPVGQRVVVQGVLTGGQEIQMAPVGAQGAAQVVDPFGGGAAAGGGQAQAKP